jgi:3-oxoacyl-[acyl-carrier protein] reductase
MRLANKVALVTGAAGGIGKETVLLFAKEGAKVVIADFAEAPGLQVLEEVRAVGGEAIFCQVNVADKQSVDAMVKKALDTYGAVDILVNNAGITRDSMLAKLAIDDWQSVIDVNLSGVFYCTQAVIPTMIKNGKGKIISTSSVSGVYGNVGQTNYAAAKAGIIGMTKTWAKELGRKGINVNAVAPGFTDTNMVAAVPEKVIEKVIQKVPMQRLGQPRDIANAYLYLASDESNYVNGTTLHVDGGIVL